MISPFEVYLVMQLDSISTAFETMCVLTGFVLFSIGSFIFLVEPSEDVVDNLQALAKKVLVAFTACFLIATFLPSTKTAAAMIVLPALTSEEVVKPLGEEARELYDLAKDALRKAVDAPSSEKTNVE